MTIAQQRESSARTAAPFVHLFQTEEAKYAYDVNSNKVLRVDDLYWAVLSDWNKSDREIAASIPEATQSEVSDTRARIQSLSESNELFSTNRATAVKAAFTREYAEEALKTECTQLVLCVSERCNLRCKYCYYTGGRIAERRHGVNLMTWETAEKALRFFLPRTEGTRAKWREQRLAVENGRTVPAGDSANRPCVGFYGGEPLTNWPLMKRVIEYVRARDKDRDYLINCTLNGTLLTPEIAKFMAANEAHLNISLDGPREYHDRYRKFANGRPSWETVVKNLRWMKENLPEYYAEHVGCLGVMAPPLDLRKLAEFVEDWELMPGSGIRFNGLQSEDPPCFWDSLDEDQKRIAGREELWNEYVEAAVAGKLSFARPCASQKEERRLRFLRHMYDIHLGLAYSRTSRMHAGKALLPPTMYLNFGMCLPGQERVFVRVDGKILPCERLPSQAPDLIIGDVDNGFDMDAIMNICDQNAAISADQCIKCWNASMCTIPCSSIVNAQGRISRDSKLEACKQARIRSHGALQSMCIVLERNRRALEFLNEL